MDLFSIVMVVLLIGCGATLYILMLPTLWECINKAAEEQDRFRSRRNKR